MNSYPFDTDVSLERIEELIKEKQVSRQITIKAKENLLTQIRNQNKGIQGGTIDEDSGNKIIADQIENWMLWHGKTIKHDLEIEDLKKKLELLEKWIAG
jgi:hypothetical protein